MFHSWTPSGDFLVCPFRILTGLLCPLCGITRGLCAFAKGDFAAAVSHHAAAPAVFAVIFWYALYSLAAALRLPVRIPDPARAMAPLGALLFVYGVVRIASV